MTQSNKPKTSILPAPCRRPEQTLDEPNKCSYNKNMNTIIKPDTQQKISLLGQMARLDCDGEPTCFDKPQTALSPHQQAKRDFLKRSIYQVQRPDGPMTVLRTMQTSACERNCHYCPFRAGRTGMIRVSLSPDELAREFDRMQRAGIVKGLFLSSGVVGGGVKAMDPMLDTVELVRRKYGYRGYVHLKIMPGAERAQVERAIHLANRVSINLEGTNPARLASLAPQKDFMGELLQAMRWVREITEGQVDYWEGHVDSPSAYGQSPPRLKPEESWIWPGPEQAGRRIAHVSSLKAPSLVTQFVVGPAGESDRELLTTVDQLYRHMKLARAYYSGFNPVPDTPLANVAPIPAIREHRLYQADWLLRFYGFALNEIPFDQEGALPSDVDPKLAWARQVLIRQPVEINRASRSELLRVPGIGPRSADAILRARRRGRLRELSDLRKLGAVASRAAPFVLLDGKQPPRQLGLWEQI